MLTRADGHARAVPRPVAARRSRRRLPAAGRRVLGDRPACRPSRSWAAARASRSARSSRSSWRATAPRGARRSSTRARSWCARWRRSSGRRRPPAPTPPGSTPTARSPRSCRGSGFRWRTRPGARRMRSPGAARPGVDRLRATGARLGYGPPPWRAATRTRPLRGLDLVDQLVQVSRWVGAETSLAVWGGGNTSVKLTEPDLLGRPVRVLRVKGSGSDLKSVTRRDFPGRAPPRGAGAPRARRHGRPGDGRLPRALPPGAGLAAAVDRDPPPRLPRRGGGDPHPRGRDRRPHEHRAGPRGRRGPLRQGDRVGAVPAPGLPAVAGGLGGHPGAAGGAGDRPREARAQHVGRDAQGRVPRDDRPGDAGRGAPPRRRAGPAGLRAPDRGRRPTRRPGGAWPARSPRSCAGCSGATGAWCSASTTARTSASWPAPPRRARLTQIGPATPDHTIYSKRLACFVPLADPGLAGGRGRRAARGGGRASSRTTRPTSRPTAHGELMKPGAGGAAAPPVAPTLTDPYPRVVLLPGLGMFTSGKDARTAGIVADIYHHTAVGHPGGVGARPVRVALRAGRLQRRVLAARALQAPDGAAREGAGAAGRAGHRRRERHRPGGGPAARPRGRPRRRDRPRRGRRPPGRRGGRGGRGAGAPARARDGRHLRGLGRGGGGGDGRRVRRARHRRLERRHRPRGGDRPDGARRLGAELRRQRDRATSS